MFYDVHIFTYNGIKQMMLTTNDKVKSCLCLLAGTFLFVLAESLLKLLTKTYTAYEIMWFRSILLIVMTIMLASVKGKMAEFKTQHLKWHLLRAFFSAGGILLTVKALSGIQLYTYKSLSFLSPTFTMILGLLIFREHLSRWYVLSFLSCLIGVLTAFQPNSELFNVYGLYAVGAALSNSLAILVFKKMARTESTYAIIFYYSLCCFILALMFIDFNQLTINWHDSYLFVGVVVLHLAASFCYTFGLRHQKLTIIGLMSYLSLPLSMLLGWVMWRDIPANSIVWASILISVGNLFILNQQLKKSKIPPK